MFLGRVAALGVVDGGVDLAAMAHDARVLEQAVDAATVEPRDRVDLEIGETRAEVFALVENREPAEPGLKPFEAEFLEDPPIVPRGHTPFVIMVVGIGLGARRPKTSGDAIGSFDNRRRHTAV